MEAEYLDLRQERCPLALLLAKRASNALLPGQRIDILITDSSSMRDIQSYLATKAFTLENEQVGSSYRISAIKEPS